MSTRVTSALDDHDKVLTGPGNKIKMTVILRIEYSLGS